MTNCTQESFDFPVCKRRKVEVNFQGGDITSNGGVLLLQQADRRVGLTEAIARTLDDPRRKASVDHDSLSLLRQRVYALALGYEDLNDHDALRLDLASSPTLCRWENRADRETAVRMHAVIADQFIASFDKAPKKLILDFDATDDAVHGKQEGRFFHGYYDHYCFLPLYVFCQNQLLVSYLRPSKIDGPGMPGRSWLCWSSDPPWYLGTPHNLRYQTVSKMLSQNLWFSLRCPDPMPPPVILLSNKMDTTTILTQWGFNAASQNRAPIRVLNHRARVHANAYF